MMLLVALTGGAVFLASFLLLIYGVDSLGLRYSVSVAIAYVVFLLLLWLWLRTDADSYEGLNEVAVDILDAIPHPTTRAAPSTGGGGELSGAGRTRGWEECSSSEPLVEMPDVSLPVADAVPDADELAIPLAVVLAVVSFVRLPLARRLSAGTY